MERFTVRRLLQVLREGRYTSVGSYPLFYLAADGDVLAYDSVKANLWQVARATRDYAKGSKAPDIRQWAIVAVDVNWEDETMTCAHSGEVIGCAYHS